MAVGVEFPEANFVFKGDGQKVTDLPCFVDQVMTISKWKLSPEEIEFIIREGHIYLCQMNYGHPLQPQAIMPYYPFVIETPVSGEMN